MDTERKSRNRSRSYDHSVSNFSGKLFANAGLDNLVRPLADTARAPNLPESDWENDQFWLSATACWHKRGRTCASNWENDQFWLPATAYWHKRGRTCARRVRNQSVFDVWKLVPRLSRILNVQVD